MPMLMLSIAVPVAQFTEGVLLALSVYHTCKKAGSSGQ